MSKIVIIAPADVDLKDALKLLKGEGHDVDTEEPTPKSLLHIVMGLLGPNAYGFGSQYAVTGAGAGAPADDTEEEEPPPPDEEAPEEDAGEEASDEGSSDDFNFESVELGKIKVDGELIEAVRVKKPTSTLCVSELHLGPKTTYSLNESIFSFWAADVNALTQRVLIETEKNCTSLEVPVVVAEDHAKLLVGDDLADLFEAEKEWAVWKADDNQSVVYFGTGDKAEEKARADHKKKLKGAHEHGSDPTLYKVGLRTKVKHPPVR
jgi:hypothetical protein